MSLSDTYTVTNTEGGTFEMAGDPLTGGWVIPETLVKPLASTFTATSSWYPFKVGMAADLTEEERDLVQDAILEEMAAGRVKRDVHGTSPLTITSPPGTWKVTGSFTPFKSWTVPTTATGVYTGTFETTTSIDLSDGDSTTMTGTWDEE